MQNTQQTNEKQTEVKASQVETKTLKLNYKRTFYMGFAFFAILMLWQMYNYYCPLFLKSLLQDQFGDDSKRLTYVIGIIMAADNIFAIFMLPLFGNLSDKTSTKMGKRMPYIFVGMIASAAIFPFVAVAFLVGKLWLVILLMGLTLLIMNIYRNPAVALMPDLTPKPLRSQANGIINFVGYLGAIAGAVIAMVFKIGHQDTTTLKYVLDNKTNAVWAFIIASVFMIIALIILLRNINENKIEKEMKEEMELGEKISEEKKATKASTSANSEATLETNKKASKKNLLLLLLSVFLWYVSFNAIETYNSIFCTEVLGDEGISAIIAAVLPISSLVTFILTINLPAKIGRKNCVLLGLGAIIFGFLIITILTTTKIISGSSAKAVKYVICLPIIFCGIGWALINANSYPMLVDMSSQNSIGKYTGYYYTASMLSQSITPIALGAIISFSSLNFDFLYVYGLITMIAAAIVFVFYHETHREIRIKKGFEKLEDND
jgi:maltose/moltooligosaccharide transporter